jgi:ABC-type transport system involved in multi-copper enzyme maturation permease subunit
MWQEFFRFDLRYQLRQPLLWIIAVAMAAIAFGSASSDALRIGGAIGNIHMNAPVVIANQLGVLSMVAMFLVTVFIAGAVLRDTEAGLADLLFATPMRKADYLFGRFLAGFGVCLAIFALIVLAMMLGSRLPSIDPARLSGFSFIPYAWSFAVLVVPNLLFVAALLMLLAAATRSLIMVYAGVLAFIVLWAVAGTLAGAGHGDSLAVLLDPFGVRALKQLTRYFSSAQANSALPPVSGLFLLNRAIWTGVALCLFAATVACFKPQRAGTKGRRGAKSHAPVKAAQLAKAPAARRIAPRFDAKAALVQWWQMLCFDAKGVVRSLPFLVMLLLAIANLVAGYIVGGMRLDSTPYPLTRLMLDEIAGGINQVLVIVLIFYSGELVFRERQARSAGLTDAMPVPDWVPLAAKAGALAAVILAFLGCGALAGIAIQLVRGGAPVELPLYLEGTLLNSAYFILMALALLSLHTIVNNKYVGYLLALALFISQPVLDSLGVHRLLNFASLPSLTYSDMNGYGHFLAGWSWFALYWGLFAAAMLVVAQLLRTRGLAPGWRARLVTAARGLNSKTGAALLAILAACGACGCWIFYNTNVINHYESSAAALDASADYEKLYRRYLALPNPSLTRVQADVDIFPAERRVAIRGNYVVRNKSATPLDSLRFQLDTRAATAFQHLPPHTVVLDDRRLGFCIIKLATPLAPGAQMAFGFTVDVRNPGFTNSGEPDGINHNGTMFTSEDYFPKLGYAQAKEITDRSERKQRGLGEPHRMPSLDDPGARASNYWKLYGFDADLVDFSTTVSTSADQVAIAPGTLTKSWQQGDRRYFQYTLDKPVLPFFSYQSARYDVRKAGWHGVPIEVYYDHKHSWNIDSMVHGSQRALDYLTQHFGAYPHKVLRITEMPLYQQYARSFPTTIPFSESLGFINDMRDPDAVDHVFYVTAHEVAHQWWGDQLIPANTQGSNMLVESLAEYSALMAVEKEFGAGKTRHILRFDLDQYLAGRGKELVEEQPLARVENQPYIGYRKGSLVFYRLREELGEDVLNRVLGEFIEQHRYQTAPYVTSADLLAAIRAAAPAGKQELVTDLFERIVMYDNRVLEARASHRPDGKWDVTMKLRLSKLQADGKGKETARAYDEPVDIAVFSRAPGGTGERVLLREKRVLPAGESMLTVTVDAQPQEVGVDPYNLLIDRVPGDNRKQVSVQ